MATTKFQNTKVGILPTVSRAPKLQIIIDATHPKDKKTYTFPFGPTATTLDNIANTYATIDRPGRPPLYVMTGKALQTVGFTITLAHLGYTSILPWINQIKSLSQTKEHIRINFGGYLTGYWRISGCTINVTQHNAFNHPLQATVDLTFTRVSDPFINVGPTSGGVKKKPGRSSGNKSSKKKKVISVYTVKRGDTLWSIALRHYHNGSKWRQIADYNHLRNPNMIRVGQKLKLP